MSFEVLPVNLACRQFVRLPTIASRGFFLFKTIIYQTFIKKKKEQDSVTKDKINYELLTIDIKKRTFRAIVVVKFFLGLSRVVYPKIGKLDRVFVEDFKLSSL